jgi:carbamoyl-phosphate synthase large subunit
MPRRDDIRKILIIGSGPIIIGQACEFDYSGTQACKALKKLGYEIVLVNSNPATIMTDPAMADVTYIEPLNVAYLTEIIAKERPDALLPTLGGQTGLNLSSALAREGVLEKYGVQVIGVNIDAIRRGEDRQEFKSTMARLGIEVPRSDIARSLEEAVEVVRRIGFPVVVRPAYTMGGTGSGFVYNLEEFQTIVSRGLSASLVGQVLVEESVLGWEELELEVVRDAKGQKITVCFIENVDAMGVHTGDSFCTAPMLTIAPELQDLLQKYSYDIVDAIEVIGGTNVQFAHDPKTGRVVVIEINPRTSRSSALASKATGFPIAFVSSLLACGLTLDEIPYWRDGSLEKYTPSGDYVVAVLPVGLRSSRVQDRLGTQMRAVGEVEHREDVQEALQKSIRSRDRPPRLGFAKDFHGSLRNSWGCSPSYERTPVLMCRPCGRGPKPMPSTSVPISSPGSSSRCGNSCNSRKDCWRTRGIFPPTTSSSTRKRTGSPTNTSPGSSASRKRRSGGDGSRWGSSRHGMRSR